MNDNDTSPLLPLTGVTVVAIEQAVAAPMATRHLADLGARVIKIERPETGDFARAYDSTVHGQSSHFIWLNRNKESIALDLKDDQDFDVLRRLIERADVFVQNLAPGAAERMGLGAQTLTEQFPELIIAGISGYGTDGPYRDKKAYDLLVQCESGVVSITGTADEPAKAGIPVVDIAAGMYTYSGILAALYERQHTGRGQIIEISMLDALVEWMGYPMLYTLYGGRQPERSGAHHAAIAPYGPFRAGDGEQVFLAVQNDREWVRFCETVLEDKDLARSPLYSSNPLRVESRPQLTALIEDRFASLATAEVIERLDQAKIANAILRDVAGAAQHPQLLARRRDRTVATPHGPVRTFLPPMLNSTRTPRMDPVPALGEHSQQIREWLGVATATASTV